MARRVWFGRQLLLPLPLHQHCWLGLLVLLLVSSPLLATTLLSGTRSVEQAGCLSRRSSQVLFMRGLERGTCINRHHALSGVYILLMFFAGYMVVTLHVLPRLRMAGHSMSILAAFKSG